MTEFIEQKIIDGIRKILTGRVNEILGNWEILTPIIEFGKYANEVKTDIALNSCETTEKERIVRQDAYSLTITFTLAETADSEIFCYGYAHAICKALGEYQTLGGIADRATVTGKKFVPPKVAHCGMEWQVIISLRITVEGMNNAS